MYQTENHEPNLHQIHPQLPSAAATAAASARCQSLRSRQCGRRGRWRRNVADLDAENESTSAAPSLEVVLHNVLCLRQRDLRDPLRYVQLRPIYMRAAGVDGGDGGVMRPTGDGDTENSAEEEEEEHADSRKKSAANRTGSSGDDDNDSNGDSNSNNDQQKVKVRLRRRSNQRDRRSRLHCRQSNAATASANADADYDDDDPNTDDEVSLTQRRRSSVATLLADVSAGGTLMSRCGAKRLVGVSVLLATANDGYMYQFSTNGKFGFNIC